MSDEHWIKRGREGYRFKGEWIYTVGPPHLYLDRRKWLCDVIGGALGHSQHSSLRILDFGGGDGWWSRYFASQLGSSVTCFDPSTSMIHRAQREFDRERVDIGPRGMEWGTIVFTDALENMEGEFDVVVCVSVLAHVPDSELHSTLAMATKSLRKGGYFILFETAGRTKSFGYQWTRRTEDEYLNLFSESDLFALEIHRYQRSLFGLAQALST